MNFWETPEWIKMKTFIAKTDKTLTKVEYLKLVGWQNYSKGKYSKYLEVMAEQGVWDGKINLKEKL